MTELQDQQARLRFTILGCGSSPGSPRIGGDWGNCDPENPKNRRRRASLLIERITASGTTTVVVDTGPDFREQMLTAGVGWADGVIYTHAHADHIHGVDDLRGFVMNRRQLVDIYADAATSVRLRESFGYCFAKPRDSNYPPILIDNRISAGEMFSIDGPGGEIPILPFEQSHGEIVSLGFRVGGVAYSCDVNGLSRRVLPDLAGLDVWIVDALQYRPHPSHFSLTETLAWIEKVKPARAILTHMHVPLDYETVLAETPARVEPAYDGMVIEFENGA